MASVKTKSEEETQWWVTTVTTTRWIYREESRLRLGGQRKAKSASLNRVRENGKSVEE